MTTVCGVALCVLSRRALVRVGGPAPLASTSPAGGALSAATQTSVVSLSIQSANGPVLSRIAWRGLSLRHCERSDAIHGATKQEWIASSQVLLAMTVRGVPQPPNFTERSAIPPTFSRLPELASNAQDERC